LAYLLNVSFLKFRNIYRVAIFLPYITSLVAVTIIFGVIFGNTQSGLANYILSWFDVESIGWKTSDWGAKVAISTMIFWRWVGYNTIIYLAGMQSIPNDLYEAAKIDGANTRQQIMHITIPMIKPFIILTVFLSTVGSLQLFVEPYLFNRAAFRSESITIVMYLYRDAFRNNAFGTASATAIVLFIMIMLVSAFNVYLTNRYGKRKEGV
jgi:cellobiose transport system permease protein